MRLNGQNIKRTAKDLGISRIRDLAARVGAEYSFLLDIVGSEGSKTGGVRLKRTGLRKPAIRRTSGRRKFAPLGEGGGAIELEILAAVEVTFLVEVVVN